MDEHAQAGTARGRGPLRDAALGVALSWGAGTVQVLAAQGVGLLLGRRERADIAPRLVQRAAERLGGDLSRPWRWLLAAGFHFGYAAGWGAAYALAQRARPVRQRPPWLTGGLLGVLIYIAAFSRIGGGTQVRSERPPERRDRREWVVQWTAALSFALSLAYGHRALRGE